jgi:hypothetical protein
MFEQAKGVVWYLFKNDNELFICRIDHLLKMKKRLVRKPIVNVNVKRLGMPRKKRNVLV